MPLPPLPQPGPNDVWGADLNAFLSALAAQAGTVKSVNGNSGPDVTADEATNGTRLGGLALQINDWNAPVAYGSGWFWSPSGSANCPDPEGGDAGFFIGQTIVGNSDAQWAVQEVYQFTSASAANSKRWRRYATAVTATTHAWTAWVKVEDSLTALDARYRPSGEGSPEGVVSAPVGARYTDKLATNGAIEWIKATGTGATGWRVAYGDTGWRALPLLNGWTGTVVLRRVGQSVSWGAEPVGGGAATADEMVEIPLGFQHRSIASVRAPDGAGNNINVRNGFLDTGSRSGFYATMDWVTDQAWPTVLPGTPA